MKKWCLSPTIRPIRVAILVLLAFLITDLALKHRVHGDFARDDFRLPADSDVLLDEYLSDLKSRPGRIVYFIGDSTVQGQKLAADQTLPARAAPLLHTSDADLTVANLGLTAAKIPDAFYLTARLRSEAHDVAVYNINYKNFGEYDLALPLRFRELYDRSLDRISGDDSREILLLGANRGEKRNLSVKADAFVREHWFLHRNRDLVNAAIFGLHPRKLIKSYYQVAAADGLRATLDRLTRKSRGKTNWESTRWSESAVETLRKYYRVETLDEDNPVFHFLRPTATLAREKGLVPVFFANPMNRDLDDRYGLVNWDLYAENIERERRAVDFGGGYFLDYTDLVPASEFIDNDHLTEAGARRLAERLVADAFEILRAQLDKENPPGQKPLYPEAAP